jgi:hypothetical protein
VGDFPGVGAGDAFLDEDRDAAGEFPAVIGWSVCLLEPLGDALFEEEPRPKGAPEVNPGSVLAFAREEAVGSSSRDDGIVGLFCIVV